MDDVVTLSVLTGPELLDRQESLFFNDIEYFKWSYIGLRPDKYLLILATVPGQVDDVWFDTDNIKHVDKLTGEKVVGCIQLQIPPEDHDDYESIVWLSFIETSSCFYRKGISKSLADKLGEIFNSHFPNKTLWRSSPGKNCPPEFTFWMDNKLSECGIQWSRYSTECDRTIIANLKKRVTGS